MEKEEKYLTFIKETLKSDGWILADRVNKIALEDEVIGQELYSKAARLIAAQRLAE